MRQWYDARHGDFLYSGDANLGLANLSRANVEGTALTVALVDADAVRRLGEFLGTGISLFEKAALRVLKHRGAKEGRSSGLKSDTPSSETRK